MPELSDSVRLSRIFAALSDPLRRQVLAKLIRRPGLTVSDLCARFPVSRFVIMRHLNLLEEAGLIDRVREGKEKHLIARPDEMRGLIDRWLSAFERKGKGNDEG